MDDFVDNAEDTMLDAAADLTEALPDEMVEMGQDFAAESSEVWDEVSEGAGELADEAGDMLE